MPRFFGRGVDLATQAELDAHVAAADPHPAYALETTVPSIDEQFASVWHPTSITATFGVGVLIAPFNCQIVSARIAPQAAGGATVAASDTNYWTVQVRRFRAGALAVIAAKTTQATGGQALTYRTDWNFNAATFDANNKLLQAGDIIDFAFLTTGAPAAIPGPICQVRYVPV